MKDKNLNKAEDLAEMNYAQLTSEEKLALENAESKINRHHVSDPVFLMAVQDKAPKS